MISLKKTVPIIVTLLFFPAGAFAADDPLPPIPKKYALLIGLNDYRFAGSLIKKLEFAVNDAKDLDQALEDQGYETTKLTDEDAKREAIVAELAKFASIVNDADTFLLYFAGHGVRNKRLNKKTYWLAYEANLAELDARGIRLSHLLDYLQDIKAGKKLILLDHCFSGELVSAELAGGSREGAGELTLERGAFAVDDVALTAGASRGFAVIAASERDAFEVRPHGIFTSVLLDALTTNAADGDHDGSVSLSELQGFVRTKVPQRAMATVNRRQTVVESSNGVLSGWVIAPNVALTAAELRPIADRYQAQVSAWNAQGSLTPAEKNWLSARVNDWLAKISTNQPLSQRDSQVITAMREIFDSVDIPDALKPKYLAQLVQN